MAVSPYGWILSWIIMFALIGLHYTAFLLVLIVLLCILDDDPDHERLIKWAMVLAIIDMIFPVVVMILGTVCAICVVVSKVVSFLMPLFTFTRQDAGAAAAPPPPGQRPTIEQQQQHVPRVD